MTLYFVTQQQEKAILTFHQNRDLSPEEAKDLIEQSLDADKGVDVVTIDLKDGSAIADYMIVASGTSSRHIIAMASKLTERLHGRGVKNVRTEGQAQGDWILVDAGDVIVHLFRPEVREFYNLEKMWCSHPTLDVISGQAQA